MLCYSIGGTKNRCVCTSGHKVLLKSGSGSKIKSQRISSDVPCSSFEILWCPSVIKRILYPSPGEIEAYKNDQIEKGEYENNDYLRDGSWGPPPDLFRYEIQETDPDICNPQVHILDSIDVKREKTVLTREKCRILMKVSTIYDEECRAWRVNHEIAKMSGLDKMSFDDIFDGRPPIFEETPGPLKIRKSVATVKSAQNAFPNKDVSEATGHKNVNSFPQKTNCNGKLTGKTTKVKQNTNTDSNKKMREHTKIPKEKQLSPQEIKQLEFEKKMQERENLKAQKKLIAEFKKLWFKPKEDLEVEDLKDIPNPDPISFKIPNCLFGDFVMILEYFSCYSSVLKVRDCFPSGLTLDLLERALLKNEIAGPLSDILQLLLRTIFRCQMEEDAEIIQDEATAASVELGIDDISDCTSAATAATTAATWSIMYQNTALHKLNLDHLSLTEVLRLHILSSGARPTEKDVKWRLQQRGGYSNIDDAGLQLRMDEPQIVKALTNGTVFDLNVSERMKLILCLINQILTYVSIRDIIDESFEQFKQARLNLRSLQATEKRKENEDTVWRQKLKSEKQLPPPDFMKTLTAAAEKKDGSMDVTLHETAPSAKPELSEEQIEAQIARRDKESARRKQDYEWKASELSDMINKHERKLGLHPVGRDRAFRRYWIFSSIPGLFVEDDDDTIGGCLANPTPFYPDVDLENLQFVKDNFEKLKQDRDGSDKENSTEKLKLAKKKSASSETRFHKTPDIFGICTGNPETCNVHRTHSTKWYFFWNAGQLDDLISGLSPRGLRESELKHFLKDERSGIVGLLEKCPVQKLNTEKKYPEYVAVPERRPQRGGVHPTKGGLDPNLGYSSNTKIEKILELQLRDLILETEEKIFLGALGKLKVADREVWRNAIEQGFYDAQANVLKWGEAKSQNLSTKSLLTNLDNRGANEEPGTSKRCMDEESNASPVIKSLACAILQLEQGVEPKFVGKPLGIEKDEDKKKKSGKIVEAEQVISKGKWIQGAPLERWETSLIKCTSFSQLFVHLFTLDNSIEWTRSVLNARCRVCRRKGDSENMVLCDGCNKGHHCYCMKPPLETIPKGGWLCADCKPSEPLPRKRPTRKIFLSDEEDDENLEESGTSEESKSDLDSDEADRHSPGPANLELGGSEVEVCAECNYGGEVICCDTCPRVYHLQCLDPPKSRVPRGSWHCPECENPKRRMASKRQVVSTKKIGTKKRKPVKKTRKLSPDSDEDVSESEKSEEYESDSDRTEDSESNSDFFNKPQSSATPLVKMKFKTKASSNYKTRSSDICSDRHQNEVNGKSDDEVEGRGKKRKCTSQTISRISQAVKRLRSDSKENDGSENSNDSSNSSCRVTRHETDSIDSDDNELPKRTRLQRMSTNRCGDSGDLDNVLLDKLINAIMKQPSAWPFLKPVTRSDAPDYHEIVKRPMDLGTIKYKLNSMVYTCNQEFFADLQLVFDNCFSYNTDGNTVHVAGETLKLYCERRCNTLGVQFSDT